MTAIKHVITGVPHKRSFAVAIKAVMTMFNFAHFTDSSLSLNGFWSDLHLSPSIGGKEEVLTIGMPTGNRLMAALLATGAKVQTEVQEWVVRTEKKDVLGITALYSGILIVED